MADVKCLAEKRHVPEWPYLTYLQPCSAGLRVLDKVCAGCPNTSSLTVSGAKLDSDCLPCLLLVYDAKLQVNALKEIGNDVFYA